jgi:hypothetical protein
MSLRERGASLLIPVVVLITVGAFAVIVAATQSGGDVQGSDAQADSVEALFLAETGLERALGRFVAGSACSAAGLGETLTDLSSIGLGTSGRTLTISAGTSSDVDFAGGALPSTQCRIQVTVVIAASSVTRTVQAVIDRNDNFIGTSLVAGFDNPSGAPNAAASWTGGAYDYTGGLPAAGGNPPNCTRSAYAVKASSGGGSASAESVGSLPVSFTVNRPVTLFATFDYRIMEVDPGSAACTTNSGGGGCPGARDANSPENTGDGEICFTLRDTGGTNYNSTRAEVDIVNNELNDDGVDVTTPSCTPTTQQAPINSEFQPCSRRYNYSGGQGGGAFTGRAMVRFTFAGGGTLSFDQFGFRLFINGGGQARELWVDNILLQPSTGAIGGIGEWRDCAVSACPAV